MIWALLLAAYVKGLALGAGTAVGFLLTLVGLGALLIGAFRFLFVRFLKGRL